MKILNIIFALGTAFATSAGSALAVTSFTETFNTNASNWLNGDAGAPTYNSTGGIDDSGYISFTAPDFNSGAGGFGDPLKILFRGNAANDASGDAFVGDWLSGGIVKLTLSVRHNYTSTLNLYARLDAGSGAAASLANIPSYSIAPNTWTTINIVIENSNPPFLSYGAGNFNSVFSNIQNLQFGFYLPANTDISGLRIDLDNVAIAVPEPHAYALGMAGLIAVVILTRRRRMSVQA